jgi:ribosomal-protein-serine acetyltransferase
MNEAMTRRTEMDPLLVDVPDCFWTERYILRAPRPGDGPALNAAVCASLDELRPWMPWAQAAPTLEESEVWCRRMAASWHLRQDLPMFVIERRRDDGEGDIVGATGLHRIDWALRAFHVGYWRRTGHGGRGIAVEAVRGITAMAFAKLAAQRVEIRMDETNRASRRVAERAGFTFEGLLRADSLNPRGEVRHTRVYSRVRGIEEP